MTRRAAQFLVVLLPSLVLTSACRIVEVDDYVHSATHDLRQSVLFKHEVDLQEGHPPVVIVPDFRTYTDEFPSKRSRLVLVSSRPVTVHLEGATLAPGPDAPPATLGLDRTTTLERRQGLGDAYLGYVGLFDESNSNPELLAGPQRLLLTVTYSIDGGPERTDSFQLKLEQVKATAWVT